MMNGVDFSKLIAICNEHLDLKPLVEPLEKLSNIPDELVVFVEKTFPKIIVTATTCLNECRVLIGNVRRNWRESEDDVEEMMCDINALVATFKKVQELKEIDSTWDMEQFLKPEDEPDAMIFDGSWGKVDGLDMNDQDFVIVTENMDVESIFIGQNRSWHQVSDDTWIVSKKGCGC